MNDKDVLLRLLVVELVLVLVPVALVKQGVLEPKLDFDWMA